MKLLTVAIAAYIVGLSSFYLLAAFEEKPWELAYYAWAKGLDMSVIGWAFIYFNSAGLVKKRVRWLFVFSWFRLAGDIQNFFTGINVNNNFSVALLFLALIGVTGYLVLMPEAKPAKWLSKHLFKSD